MANKKKITMMGSPLRIALFITLVLMSGFAWHNYRVLADGPRLLCEASPAPGDVVYVAGEGFSPGVVVNELSWDDVMIPWQPTGLTVGNDGRFTLSFAAPLDSYELHTLVVTDSGGLQGECYLNLTPRNPTPTFTPTPTMTPVPTPTWTPGPPLGMVVPPTPIPGPEDYCANISTAYTRNPIAGGTITVGMDVTNTNIPWPDGRMIMGVWKYRDSMEMDTGVRAWLPALVAGQSTTLPLSFVESEVGPMWYQARLIDADTGVIFGCVSPWFGLYVQEAIPLPPALNQPADGTWLNSRTVIMSWSPARVPLGASPADAYEARLMARDGSVLYQAADQMLSASYELDDDYAAGQLAWQVRARNAAGWGPWSAPAYLGADTGNPLVEMALSGTMGENGWYRSPVKIVARGHDTMLGSGLAAAFLQMGNTRWQQIVPDIEITTEQEGQFMVRVYGRDAALNRSPVVATPVKIDMHAPENVEVVFSSRPNASGWYTAPVTIDVMAQDLVSGVGEKLLRVDGGSWQTGAVNLTANGSHVIEFAARDQAGNETELRQTTAKLDLMPPLGQLAIDGSLCQACTPLTATVSVEDVDSGVGHWILSWELPSTSMSQLSAASTGNTILASGSDSRQVVLQGSDLPVGILTMRLTIQDVAGWIAYSDFQVANGAASPGPTPTTPRTVTPGPTPTATGSATPGATGMVTPQATPTSDDDNDNNDSSGSNSGGSGDGGNAPVVAAIPPEMKYPVGSQVVPAVLPVTGEEHSTSSGGIWLLVAFSVLGLLFWGYRSRQTDQRRKFGRRCK